MQKSTLETEQHPYKKQENITQIVAFKPILTYRESLDLKTKQTNSRIQPVEIGYLRAIKRVIRRNRIINEIIRE